MNKEDYILRKIYNAVMWIFIGLMVLCLCIAVARERSQSRTIDELEQNVINLEEYNDTYTKQIAELNEEIQNLNALLDTTKKQYEDRIAELEKSKHDDELRYYSNESLQRGYKLTEEVWVN